MTSSMDSNPLVTIAHSEPLSTFKVCACVDVFALLRLVGLYSGIILLTATMYLLASTPPTGKTCWHTIRLGYHMSILLNCDAVRFGQDAIEPSGLLMPRAMRQDRPVFVIAAALLTHLLIVSKVWRLVPTRIYTHLTRLINFEHEWPLHVQYVLCAYFAYILINFVLLLASLIMFHYLTTERLDADAGVAAFASFLVINHLVKHFFWSPHTQMFNIVVPLASVYMCREILQRPFRGVGWFAGAGALTGMLALAYGSFAICMVSGVFAVMVAGRRAGWQGNLLDLCLRIVALVVGFALPTLSWIVMCKLIAGSYYNHEMLAYRQFVWLLDAERLGWPTFISSLISHLMEFMRILLPVLSFPLMLTGTIIVFAIVTQGGVRAIVKDRQLMLLAIGITTITSFAFLYLMGFYLARIELELVMLVLLAAAILQTALLKRPDAATLRPIITSVLWIVVLGRLVYELLKSGPWD